MASSLQKTNEYQLSVDTGYSIDQVNLIKRVIAVGSTDDELRLFLYQAKKMGLDPISKQIYFQKYKSRVGESKMTIIVSIDGYRAIADRTGLYAGADDAEFDLNDEGLIVKASVTVYKIVQGIRCAFKASARWDEYCPPSGKDHMWQKMPHTMLAKCAEALALRKAFPDQMSGTYTNDEMSQADVVVEQKTTGLPQEVLAVQKTHSQVISKEQYGILASLFKDLAWTRDKILGFISDKGYSQGCDILQSDFDSIREELEEAVLEEAIKRNNQIELGAAGLNKKP